MKKILCLVVLGLMLTGCGSKDANEQQTTDGNIVHISDTVDMQTESEDANEDTTEVINQESCDNYNALDEYISDYQVSDMETEVYAVYNYTDWSDFWNEPDLDPLEAQLEECGVDAMVSRYGSFDEDSKTVEIVIYDFPEDMISVFETKYNNVLEIKDIKHVWNVDFWSDTKIPDFMLNFLQEDEIGNNLNVKYWAYNNHEEQLDNLPAAYQYLFYFYEEPTDELISNAADMLFDEYNSLACNTTDYVYYYHENNMDSIARSVDDECDCDITYANFSKVMRVNSEDTEVVDEFLGTINWTSVSTIESESGEHNASEEVIKFNTLDAIPAELLE